MRLLLDANAILKRYIAEPGSDVVEAVYRSADSGDAQLVYSLWSVGECLGVLDRLQRQGRLPPGGLSKGRRALLGESARMGRLGVLTIAPLGVRLVRKAWTFLLRHHLYQADAIQIATGLAHKVDVLLTSDGSVARAATVEGLRVLDPEREGTEIVKALAS